MGQTRQLLELQQLDSEQGHKKARLRDMEGKLGDDSQVVAARSDLETREQHLTEMRKAQKEAEWAAEDLLSRIKQFKEKLYTTSARNPKEALSITREMENLASRRNEEDGKALELLDAVEEEQKAVAQSKLQLGQLEKDWQAAQNSLQEEIAKEKEALKSLGKRRDVLAKSLESQTLELYEMLRTIKQGLAVARVEKGVCLGCRITLTINEMQRARMGQDLVLCSSCGRIMCTD